MERSEQARTMFFSGNNCAQSVVLSFAETLKFSKELALKMSAGFGGGMGKQQETCGAVTGAIMVLGLLNGERVNNNDELKSRTYGSVKDFTRKFVEDFGSTNCRDLTGCNFDAPGGNEKFKEEGIMESVCAGCVKKAVQIVESMTGS